MLMNMNNVRTFEKCSAKHICKFKKLFPVKKCFLIQQMFPDLKKSIPVFAINVYKFSGIQMFTNL